MIYKNASIIDKRNFSEYYFSLIKTKHLIVFTFYTKNDYNSKSIKISIFLFILALSLTVNSLFFDHQTMHQIYEDKGDYNFIDKIPIIFYSTFISSAINIIIKYFSLTDRNVISLKKGKMNDGMKEIQNIRNKFVIFFILLFSLLLLFWYYVSCFCVVYKNTQIHLIKDTIVSFVISVVSPFLLYLIPGFFRIQSLKKQNSEFLYNLSKIIQLI